MESKDMLDYIYNMTCEYEKEYDKDIKLSNIFDVIGGMILKIKESYQKESDLKQEMLEALIRIVKNNCTLAFTPKCGYAFYCGSCKWKAYGPDNILGLIQKAKES